MTTPENPELVHLLPSLPPRAAEGHKGDYGRVLVIAGSRGMSGAAVLAGSAALRGGAGLVYVAVPEEIQPTVAAGNSCYLTAGLLADEDGRLSGRAEGRLLELTQGKDVLAVGPGLGQSRGVTALVLTLLG